MRKNDMEMYNGELSEALICFQDIDDFQEAEENLEKLYRDSNKNILDEHIEHISSFVDSSPDLVWVKDFVTWVMNWDLPDQTGSMQLEWIKSALEIMKKFAEGLEADKI